MPFRRTPRRQGKPTLRLPLARIGSYGLTLIFGLTEVARLPPARPRRADRRLPGRLLHRLRRPIILSLLQAAISPPALLLGAAALATLTLPARPGRLTAPRCDNEPGH
jgi:hypothetical protein